MSLEPLSEDNPRLAHHPRRNVFLRKAGLDQKSSESNRLGFSSKVDFNRTAKKWTCPTCQLDLGVQPKKRNIATPEQELLPRVLSAWQTVAATPPSFRMANDYLIPKKYRRYRQLQRLHNLFCFRTIWHVAEDSRCFGMITTVDDNAYIIIRACDRLSSTALIVPWNLDLLPFWAMIRVIRGIRNLIGQYDVQASYSSS